jgi:threonine/homoserine/homoserine lactone efflux protein
MRPPTLSILWPVAVLGVLIPEHLGWLEVIFLGLLLTLVALVGVFALFVLVQQFRNPGRPVRR